MKNRSIITLLLAIVLIGAPAILFYSFKLLPELKNPAEGEIDKKESSAINSI